MCIILLQYRPVHLACFFSGPLNKTQTVRGLLYLHQPDANCQCKEGSSVGTIIALVFLVMFANVGVLTLYFDFVNYYGLTFS